MPLALTPEIISLLLQAALKYGPEVAQAFAGLFKGGKTIDDAISALELAKTKTAEQYLAEAKAAWLAEQAASAVILPPNASHAINGSERKCQVGGRNAGLFAAGVITKAEQDALHLYVDAKAALAAEQASAGLGSTVTTTVVTTPNTTTVPTT